MAASPETLRIVQAIHDTVRDTVMTGVAVEPSGLSAWKELELFVNIGAGLATIFAAVVAVRALGAWRHQLKGSTEYKLAIRVLRALLRLRDRITAAREPFNHMVPIYEGESDTNTPEFVERERKKYWEYFREVIQADLALKALRPEAEIHWGLDATKHIDAIDERARTLRGNYIAYFQGRLRVLRGERSYAQVVESCRKVIFNTRLTDQDQDEYGDGLDVVVRGALDFLNKKIDLTK